MRFASTRPWQCWWRRGQIPHNNRWSVWDWCFVARDYFSLDLVHSSWPVFESRHNDLTLLSLALHSYCELVCDVFKQFQWKACNGLFKRCYLSVILYLIFVRLGNFGTILGIMSFVLIPFLVVSRFAWYSKWAKTHNWHIEFTVCILTDRNDSIWLNE